MSQWNDRPLQIYRSNLITPLLCIGQLRPRDCRQFTVLFIYIHRNFVPLKNAFRHLDHARSFQNIFQNGETGSHVSWEESLSYFNAVKWQHTDHFTPSTKFEQEPIFWNWSACGASFPAFLPKSHYGLRHIDNDISSHYVIWI